MSPQEQQVWESLKVDTDEGRAGRIVGGLAAAVQGVVEFGAGAGAVGGGVAACGTGVLCVGGAPAIVAGAAGVVHGGGTAISGVGAAGQEIGWFLAQTGSGGRPSIRNLTPEDIGARPETFTDFRASSWMEGDRMVVQVDMIERAEGQQFDLFLALSKLKDAALNSGASVLRIQGTLAGEELAYVAGRRWNIETTWGGEYVDFILK